MTSNLKAMLNLNRPLSIATDILAQQTAHPAPVQKGLFLLYSVLK
jgi:hypothetical protein